MHFQKRNSNDRNGERAAPLAAVGAQAAPAAALVTVGAVVLPPGRDGGRERE